MLFGMNVTPHLAAWPFRFFVLFEVDILDDRITEVFPTTHDILHSLYASKSVWYLSFATGLNEIHYG